MSETRPHPRDRPRDRAADLAAPIPYRGTEGLQVTTTSKAQGGGPTHFVRSRKGEVVQLGEEEYLLFTLLDGQPSFADIQREFKARFAGDLSRKHFQSFIEELLAAGIIERSEPEGGAAGRSPPGARKAVPVEPASEPYDAAGGAKPDAMPQAMADAGADAGADAMADAMADPAMAERADPRRGDGVTLLPLFLAVARLGAPLRYFVWLLVVAVPIAGIALFDTETWLAARLAALDWPADWPACGPALHGGLIRMSDALGHLDWPAIGAAAMAGVHLMAAGLARAHRAAPHLARDVVVALLACLLVPRIAEGAAAAYHGAPRATFRFRRTGWVLPRFPVDRAGIDLLPRRGRACAYAAPLLVRLALFVIGAAIATPRDQEDGHLAVGAVLLGLVAAWWFLLAATPLWPGEGRRWLAAYFDEPALDRGLLRRRTGAVRGRGFLIAASLIFLAAIAGAALPWIGVLEAASCW